MRVKPNPNAMLREWQSIFVSESEPEDSGIAPNEVKPGTLLVVGVEYADRRDELEKGLSRTPPLVLEPSMALDLAEAVKIQATMLFGATPDSTSVQ